MTARSTVPVGTDERRLLRQRWKNIIQWCHNPRNCFYPIYGGRGIAVCTRWVASFDAFLRDVGARPPGRVLDRRDKRRGFEPGNVRWATRREQARGRSTTRLLTYAGETMPALHWARRFGLDDATLGRRLERGWSLSRALTTPTDRTRRPDLYPPKPPPIKQRRRRRGVDTSKNTVETVYGAVS